MIFDTHAHVLSADTARYPHSTLRGGTRPPVPPMVFPVERLVEAMDREGVDRACLVQRATLYGYDNSYALQSAADHPDRFRAVAVLDAQDPAAPVTLARLVREHGLAGLRIVAPKLDALDTEWLASDQALALWAAAADHGLPVAVILYRLNSAAGLAAMRGIARRFATLPIVLDHCGVPHASTPETKWAQSQGLDYAIDPPPGFGVAEALGAFAELAHVHFKVTDINFERLEDAGHDLAAFVRRLADVVGEDRLVWGSDVGQSTASYGDMLARAHHAAAGLSEPGRQAFLGGTAARLYG
ncbi:MAG TPA: amidohydrolase family protein [Croceibacterium sp.]